MSINVGYRMITGSRYLSRDEKEKKRSKYEVDNLRLSKFPKKKLYFDIRITSRVCRVL